MIEFDVNENQSAMGNQTSDDNSVVNVSTDEGLLSVESAAFSRSSPKTENDALASRSNNNDHAKISGSDFLLDETTVNASNNCEENLKNLGANKTEIFYSPNTSNRNESLYFEIKNISPTPFNGSYVPDEDNDSLTKTTNLNFQNELTPEKVEFSPLKNEFAGSGKINLENSPGITHLQNVSSNSLGYFSVEGDQLQVMDVNTEIGSTITEETKSNVTFPFTPDINFGDCSFQTSDNALASDVSDSLSKIKRDSTNVLIDFCNSPCKQSENPVNYFHGELDNIDFAPQTSETSIAELADVINEMRETSPDTSEEFADAINAPEILTDKAADDLIDVTAVKIMPDNLSSSIDNLTKNDLTMKVLENLSNNVMSDLSNVDLAMKVPGITASKEMFYVDSAVKVTENTTSVLKEMSDSDLVMKVAENPTTSSKELSATDLAEKVLESPSNKFKELSCTDFAMKVAENPTTSSKELAEKILESSSNRFKEISNTDFAMKVDKNPTTSSEVLCATDCTEKILESPSNTFKESSDSDLVLKVLEKSTSADADLAMQVPETPSNILKELPNNDLAVKVTGNPTDGPKEGFGVGFAMKLPISPVNAFKELTDVDLPMKVPESLINNSSDDYNGAYISQISEQPTVSEDILNNEREDNSPNTSAGLSNVDYAFKVPEYPINKKLGEASTDDFMFKIPDVPPGVSLDQFTESDFAFKIPDVPTNVCDEEFTDAVQFFKDPNSFQFLENIRTSTQPESVVPRSSLYVNFDPLHSKFLQNGPQSDNCALITAAVNSDASKENLTNSPPEFPNKLLGRESMGNILISFDSPKAATNLVSSTSIAKSPPKLFTEEQLQQLLKIYELETQEIYLKKQKELESQIAKREDLCKAERIAMEELLSIVMAFAEESEKARVKIESLEAENKKLSVDLKTSTEDLQSVENTFADFHKRYEQSKVMLKSYKENEEHFKQQIADSQTREEELKQMYRMLQERTEEMLQKANAEVAVIKKAGEAQVTVLKAQLKKAELKISGLESDIRQIKIENSQLGGICDDLMAKVSEA